MSKKVIGLLTVAVFLFGFAMTAAADYPAPTDKGSYPAVTISGKTQQAANYFQLKDGIYVCPNSKVNNVPCYKPASEQGMVDLLCPFDYDNGVNGVLPGNYGYCSANKSRVTNSKAVINICYCPDACKNVTGTKIGLQMEILTPGVYWAKDPKTFDAKNNRDTVWFNMYTDGTPIATMCNDATTPTNNFGEIRYYLRTVESINNRGYYVRTPQTPGVPLGDGSTYRGEASNAQDCFISVPPANQVKVIESQIASDFLIQNIDAGKCIFAIDIPAMRLDSTAKAGDAIQVRITLLWDRILEGLCPECNPPILCEMIQTVATICCDSIDTGCIFFPYALQGLESSSGWVTGIAISARDSVLPLNAYCELILKDSKGTIATYKKTDMKTVENGVTKDKLVWAFVLDREMKNFNKTLEPGAVSLQVNSNYRIDGYAFMNANMTFGAGEMPRACGTSCNP